MYKVNTLFPVPLSKKENLFRLSKKLLKYGTISTVCVDNSIAAAMCGYTNDEINGLAYMSILATLPEYSGKGYGELAVKDFIRKSKEAGMKAVHLYAVPSNIPAMRMYSKLGFVDYKIDNEPRPDDAHLILYL